MNIHHISYYLPKTTETVIDAAKRLGIDNDQVQIFTRLFGLNSLPIDLATTVEPLMIHAVQQCLAKSNIDKHKIKYLIHAHTATHNAPFGKSVVRTIQHELGLTHALAFGSSMGKCGSVFIAFQIANQLFTHLNQDEYILIVTGDISFTEILQFIPGTTITTDGACAILLSKSGVKNKLLSIEVKTDGTFAGGVWNTKETQYLFEINYAHYLSDVIKKAISKAHLTIDDIKIILPHNVNLLSWNRIMKLLNLNKERIYLDNISRTAHCFGSDPFINYQDAIEDNRIQTGDYFLLATVGLGATYASMVFQH